MEIKWNNCEPTRENFWENIKRCDKYNRLHEMLMIIPRYYDFEENTGNTPKDLELDFRKHGLNVGLIACDSSKDLDLKKALESDLIMLIKPQYINGKNKIDLTKAKEEHMSSYNTKVSCRPREYVIKETLEYCSSMEENLEKLAESGDIVSKNGNQKISENDVVLNNKEISLAQLIKEGKKLISFKKVDLKEIFSEAEKKYPNAKTFVCAMGYNGAPIFALIENSKIVCPIGITASFDNNGNQIISYVPLPR
jgi:hypothetical protein